MSRLPITTDEAWSTDPEDWLPNPHAGEMLASEFLEPLALSTDELGKHLGVDTGRIDAMIAGRARMDAELDLRLARYFRMSNGFFLRFQDRHEIVEAKRALNGALDRIVPRAA